MRALYQKISEAGGISIFRGIRSSDGRSVVVKVLDPRRTGAQAVARLKTELEIGRMLDTTAAVKPLALETYEGLPALVSEDFLGESLDHLLRAPMEVERFLRLAMGVTNAVAEIHRWGVVHKNLTPENILVDPVSGEVKIANFGIAARLPRVPTTARSPGIIEGPLTHMSPEQTGRINRAVDTRSDLYSLGVTFYQMLTGRLPFEAGDPVEWTHCQIARSPAPPSAIVSSIPGVVSAMVLQLLAKSADDRYQTATGLRRDLERCLNEWQSTQRITPFLLRERDVADRFLLPHRLYGRDQQVARLMGAFERVLATSSPALVLVSGPAGIGKSSLVERLREHVAGGRGFFASGKFDQYKRDIPYSTIAQAGRELVLQILAESEARIAIWRERLLGALGLNSRLLVDLIPLLEFVIGPQPPLPDLALSEAENRFQKVFVQFVQVFAQKEHPATLFLDDLQWVDSASLRLLAHLAALPALGPLLLIGAYRDNEVTPSHPLRIAVDEAARAGATIDEILLRPLSAEDTGELIADIVHREPAEIVPFTRLVHEKTAGNPFFAIQFLVELQAEGLLEFDPRRTAWRWDAAKIQAKGHTNNVVELMVGKLRRLSSASRDLTAVASCVGNAPDVHTLALLVGKNEEELHHDLSEVVNEGLLGRVDGVYRFPHDRVQEAAYALIPVESRGERHLQIGRLLLSRMTPVEQRECIFDIAIHLNRGGAQITDRREKVAAAEVDRLAGEKAMASAAFGQGAAFFAAGIAHLGVDGFAAEYPLAFELHLQQASCEMSARAIEAAERLLGVLAVAARGQHDRTRVCLLQINLNILKGREGEATRIALETCAEIFGIRLDEDPTDEQVREAIDDVWATLNGRSIEALVDLPRMTDPNMRDASAILSAAFPAVYYAGKINLYDLIICRLAKITLQYGNSDEGDVAPVVYVKLGGLAIRRGMAGEARRYGKLAEALVERYHLVAARARIAYILTTFISFWLEHPRQAEVDAERGCALAVELGDLTHELYGRVQVALWAFDSGRPLPEVAKTAARALDLARRARGAAVFEWAEAFASLLSELQGVPAALQPATSQPGYFMQCQFRLIACLLRDDPDEATRLCLELEKNRVFSREHPIFSEYTFYSGLAFAACHDAAPEPERAQLRALVAERTECVRRWAEMNPAGQRNRHSLLSAELARIEGRAEEAMHVYDRAIDEAREEGFVHLEAIACETAARFFCSRGHHRIAEGYLGEARFCYARWGANAKVADLDRRFPHLVARAAPLGNGTFASGVEQLDLLSVIKASQRISGEIVLERLLRALMSLLLEAGGGQHGGLLLVRDGELSLEAEAAFEGANISVKWPRCGAGATHLPASIINTAWHTGEVVVLDDAAARGRFAADPYVVERRLRSALCLPILRQAEVVGVLYLENNLVAGAFTSDRIAVLQILAAQAAISLQNARLIEGEQAGRMRAEEAERRSAFLAEASRLLGESLELEQVLLWLAELAVHDLADWCVIDLIQDGIVCRAAAAAADPARQPLLDELRLRYPVRPGSAAPASSVLETGIPLVFSDLTDAELRARATDEEHARLLRELGARSVLVVPLVARGQILGAITICSARPGRYGAADLELGMELARRAAMAIDNARLYRETQDAVRLRDEFLSIASHELRTPITSLQLMMQSLLKGVVAPPSEHVQRAARIADRQIFRLTRLVEDLLDVSRIHSGRLALQLEDFDLVAVVCEVAERFEAELARAGCTLSLCVAPSVVGRWDRSRIEQVVTNLLSNALKFGAGRPIEIAVEEVPRGTAHLVVADHGIGIPPSRLPYIFEKFERAVSAREYGGLGLGLFIVRSIVDALEGTVRAESTLGLGSSFTVTLPCEGPRSRESNAI